MKPTFVILMTLSLAGQKCCVADEAHVGEKLFSLKVLPLLKTKCFGCHGMDQDDVRGDYNLMTRKSMIHGGESGVVALVPGKPTESLLYQAILWEGMEMPPKETDRLSPDEADLVRQWIAAGAPWPNEARRREILQSEWAVRQNADGVIVDTSGGLAEDWTYRRYQLNDIWAFQPVIRPQVPAGSAHPVDAFVDARLAAVELKAANTAGPETLIRRATYDITGLPPTLQEIADFSKAWNENSATAWVELVDRLLDSPHYGERAAQHWLDVVRYADTAGFSNDYERSNAWRYRDYVIRSFNEDKPYNDFVVEQLAGDELRADDPEALIATGFLRMGPWGTAMVPQEEARQIYLDDLVHNVGQTFLAMPMRCCKCHDHKFDPLPTRDYYGFYAAFATTQPAERDVAFLPEENRGGFNRNRQLVQELLDYARSELKKVNDKQEAAAKKWYEEHNLPYKNENQRRKDPEDMKPPRHVGLTHAEKGIKKVREQDVWIWNRRLERYQPMAQAVYNGHDDYKNGRKLRMPGKIRREWRPENFILTGGALDAPGPKVSPGVLSAVGLATGTESENGWELPDSLSGRRLSLARWIVSEKNPLTARTIVNRVWQSHFGTGLVRTSNNFGAKGGRPSHPQLLDWLATDFVRNGWKLKRLHKLIMMSATYQRSGVPVDGKRLDAADPDNRLLSVFPPRRLTAEEMRDSMLLVSGELNREMGGVPIMPEINMEVALQPRMIQFSIAPAYQPSRTPQERNRRTIYAYRVRGQANPFLEVLNLPGPNESCELRDSASVTPQAFTLMNSDTMTDRSIAFALRVQKEQPGQPGVWLRRVVQLAYGRLPTDDEQEHLSDYLSEMRRYHQKHIPKKVEYPKQVVRSLVEEFTGNAFEFIEKLNVYEDYVPDAKAWTVEADTRALADVCLLLFNSNEFMYVY